MKKTTRDVWTLFALVAVLTIVCFPDPSYERVRLVAAMALGTIWVVLTTWNRP